MSNYQFVVFSGKNKNRSIIKQEDVESETDELLSENQREVDSPSSSSLSIASSSTSSTSSHKQLIVLTSSSDNVSNRATIECDSKKRKTNNVEKQQASSSRKRESSGNIFQVHIGQNQLSVDAGASQLGGKYTNSNAPGKAKIPRPANAFMLFANEWRRKLANENPRESNKDISVRLGVLWKNMEKDAKEKYFSLARQVDAEHKRKYPDYVYNPKEARIRKAMREQCRELSRQSILQSTVTATNGDASATGANSTNGNVENIAGERGAPGAGGRGGAAAAGAGGRGGSRSGSAGGRASDGGEIGTGNFLSHPTSYASPAPPATGSSLPSTSGYDSRIINPWFPVGHTPPANLPIHSHRVMQAHQRTFDKSEEVLRKRAKCAGAFSAASAAAASSYPGDFTVHGAPTQAASGTSVGGLESNDYRGGGGSVSGIGEFSDAQKWHPYQNAAAAHHHPRIPLTRMTSRHPIQNINPQNHGPWNQQYFGLPLYPMATQNQMVRSPRHVVFVQNQQERHTAGYPDEMPMNYMTNRIETSHRLQPSYSQNNYQETEKCIEDAPRWDQPSTSAEPPIANLVTSPREPERVRETQPPKKEETNKEYQKNVEPQPRTQSNQRLPGFPQAFGSTEIGRFSRTHNFADMVVPDNNVSDGSICSSSGSGIVPGNSNGVSRNRNFSNDTSSDINSQSSRVDSIDLESLSNPSDEVIANDDLDNASTDNVNSLSSLSTMTSHYDSVRTTMPRWHSPYVSALIPDGYLPVSMFPFHPASSNNLRSNVPITRGHPSAKEIILPNDYYWIAQNIGYPVTNISDPNSNYVTFLEVPRVNCDCIPHSNPIQVSQNFSTPTSTERPTFIYHDTQVPGGSRQANQSPEKKSSGSESSNLSVNNLTYSASTELKPFKNKSAEVEQKETQVKEENDNDDDEEEDEDESVEDEDEEDDDDED